MSAHNRSTATSALERAKAFVAEAERMTNERDVDGIRAVFAPGGRWTSTIDGTVISAQGIDEIHRRWGAMCRFMAVRRMSVNKSLVTADLHTIVNEWIGEVAGRRSARGIEVWQLDEDGRVTDQRLYGFLDARPDADPLQNVRMLIAHPRTAIAAARTKGRAAAR
jgi:hypothetical protein